MNMPRAAAVLMLASLVPSTAGFAGPEECQAAFYANDWPRALGECQPLAGKGRASAQFNLGLMYKYGRGVKQDYAEAMRLFRLAADQGRGGAQINLGFMYNHGQGVVRDYVLAHMWFSLAAAQGMERAKTSRKTVAKKMTPEQIAEAQKLAQEWKPK